MTPKSERVTSLLTSSWPGLLLSVVGIILALVMLGSYRKPATLVLIAMVLVLLNTLRWPVFELVYGESARARSYEDYSRVFRLQGWIGQAVHVVYMSLLLLAAFAGRKSSLIDTPAFPMYPGQPPMLQGFRPPPPPR